MLQLLGDLRPIFLPGGPEHFEVMCYVLHPPSIKSRRSPKDDSIQHTIAPYPALSWASKSFKAALMFSTRQSLKGGRMRDTPPFRRTLHRNPVFSRKPKTHPSHADALHPLTIYKVRIAEHASISRSFVPHTLISSGLKPSEGIFHVLHSSGFET